MQDFFSTAVANGLNPKQLELGNETSEEANKIFNMLRNDLFQKANALKVGRENQKELNKAQILHGFENTGSQNGYGTSPTTGMHLQQNFIGTKYADMVLEANEQLKDKKAYSSYEVAEGRYNDVLRQLENERVRLIEQGMDEQTVNGLFGNYMQTLHRPQRDEFGEKKQNLDSRKFEYEQGKLAREKEFDDYQTENDIKLENLRLENKGKYEALKKEYYVEKLNIKHKLDKDKASYTSGLKKAEKGESDTGNLFETDVIIDMLEGEVPIPFKPEEVIFLPDAKIYGQEIRGFSYDGAGNIFVNLPSGEEIVKKQISTDDLISLIKDKGIRQRVKNELDAYFKDKSDDDIFEKENVYF